MSLAVAAVLHQQHIVFHLAIAAVLHQQHIDDNKIHR